jgi:hypothetical protein
MTKRIKLKQSTTRSVRLAPSSTRSVDPELVRKSLGAEPVARGSSRGSPVCAGRAGKRIGRHAPIERGQAEHRGRCAAPEDPHEPSRLAGARGDINQARCWWSDGNTGPDRQPASTRGDRDPESNRRPSLSASGSSRSIASCFAQREVRGPPRLARRPQRFTPRRHGRPECRYPPRRPCAVRQVRLRAGGSVTHGGARDGSCRGRGGRARDDGARTPRRDGALPAQAVTAISARGPHRGKSGTVGRVDPRARGLETDAHDLTTLPLPRAATRQRESDRDRALHTRTRTVWRSADWQDWRWRSTRSVLLACGEQQPVRSPTAVAA